MKMQAVEKRHRFAGLRITLRGAEWLFLLAGIAALDIYLWVNAVALVSQAYSDWAFDQKLRGLQPSLREFAKDEIHILFGRERARLDVPEASIPPAKRERPPSAAPPVTSRPAPFALLGRLEIPNVRLIAMVREGADARTLRHAVGHIPGTALPGMAGNIGLAGHRDTFFRALRNIQKNDTIELQTENGDYQYLVDSIKIVGPRDVQVLSSSNQPVLTLVTCYPFYYIGSAPKRFIVRASLVSQSTQRRSARGE